MKLLNKVGDALLTKLVPGVDAKAGCGRCRVVARRCDCASIYSFHVWRVYYYDDCGRECGPGHTCSSNKCNPYT